MTTQKRGDGAVAAHPLFHGEGSGSIPRSPLQFNFEEIGMRLAADLNRRWHSMLPRTDLGNLLCGSTSVAYAALFDDRWWAVSIWTQPIIRSMCDGKTIELRRLAISRECPKNTASCMLACNIKQVKSKFPFLSKAISYLAVDVHVGTIYKASGWVPSGEIVDARPQRFSNHNKNTRATGPLQTTSRKQRWQKDLPR